MLIQYIRDVTYHDRAHHRQNGRNGAIVNVSDADGQQLIERGWAIEAPEQLPPKPAKKDGAA